MNSREDSLDAVKDEDEFLNFEFDDLEETPQKATDGSDSEEEDEIIELVDIVEDDDIIGDSGSDEIAQFLEEETMEARAESGDALEAKTDDSELELDFFENFEGTEAPLGEEEASPEAEEEGSFMDEASQSLEIDLDAALKNLEDDALDETAAKDEETTEKSDPEAFFGEAETGDELEIRMEEDALKEESLAESFSPPETEDLEGGAPSQTEAAEFEESKEPATEEAFALDLDEVIETPGGLGGEEREEEPAAEAQNFEFETEEERLEENPPQTQPSVEISEEKLETMITRVVEEVVERVARETMTAVAERVARETVSAVAERVLGEAIEALKQSLDSPSE